MIDSHCHLADPKFASDLEVVLKAAALSGVEKILTIADSISESRKCLALAEKYEQLFCTIGVHPHHAKQWKISDEAALKLLADSPRVKAIGEIGLDYHYDFSPRDVQRSVFAAQLSLAKELKLPVVVHCREAITDIREALREFDLSKVVLHCCTERWEDVRELAASGCRLSFTGIATYPHAEEIRRVIRECPLAQMMIETDAPYLAPIPYRGKRNEPAYVVEVAKLVAKIKGISLEEVDRVTTGNTVAFFSLPA